MVFKTLPLKSIEKGVTTLRMNMHYVGCRMTRINPVLSKKVFFLSSRISLLFHSWISVYIDILTCLIITGHLSVHFTGRIIPEPDTKYILIYWRNIILLDEFRQEKTRTHNSLAAAGYLTKHIRWKLASNVKI